MAIPAQLAAIPPACLAHPILLQELRPSHNPPYHPCIQPADSSSLADQALNFYFYEHAKQCESTFPKMAAYPRLAKNSAARFDVPNFLNLMRLSARTGFRFPSKAARPATVPDPTVTVRGLDVTIAVQDAIVAVQDKYARMLVLQGHCPLVPHKIWESSCSNSICHGKKVWKEFQKCCFGGKRSRRPCLPPRSTCLS